MLILLNSSFNDWCRNNAELLGVIVSMVALFATCLISGLTSKQTQKIHKQSIDIELYDKRKNLLDKISDDKFDVSIELELLFGKTFSNAYQELKLNKNRISFLNDQMVRLESVYQEDKSLMEEYQDLRLHIEETNLTELYSFYDSHTITYYCPEIENYFHANGKEISQELNRLNKIVEEKEKQLKNKMKNFINKTINVKINKENK